MTPCVFIYVSIWIRAHTHSSANKTLERDRVIVSRKGGRDTGRERSNEGEKYIHCGRTLETAREIGGESAHKRQRKTIFQREGRLWNSCGTHKIHKRFLTESTGSTWVGKEQRDNVETVHTHLF